MPTYPYGLPNSFSAIQPQADATGRITGYGAGLPSRFANGGSFNGAQPGANNGSSGGSPFSPGGYGLGFGGGNMHSLHGGNGGGGNDNPGFQTLNNVKSGNVQNLTDNYLGNVGGQKFNPNVNPNALYTNTKNPAIQASLNAFAANIGSFGNPTDFTKSGQYQTGINNTYAQAATDKNTNRNAFSDYADLFKSQTPTVTANTDQENSAIGRVYGSASDPNSLQGGLNKIADDRAAAVNLSANRALGNVGRNNALLRLSGGDSSYATHQALDTAAGIYADEARQKADNARQNYTYVQQQQAALSNARNQNLGFLANRQLQPVDALTRLGNSEDARLYGIGNADLSNNIYTTPQEKAQQRLALLSGVSSVDNANNIYQTDSQQAFLARQAALLGQGQALNNNNNFYGLSKPYEPDFSGYGLGQPTNHNNFQPNYQPYVQPNYYRPNDAVTSVTGNGSAAQVDPQVAAERERARYTALNAAYNNMPRGTIYPASRVPSSVFTGDANLDPYTQGLI